MDNPLLQIALDVPFDRITAAHVEPAVKALIAEARAALAAIASAPPTYDATLGALERATETLDWAITVVGHLDSVATTEALRVVYNEVQPLAAELWTSIPLDPGLYRALRAFAATDEAKALDPTRRRFLDKTLADFRRHGAELAPADKQKLQALDVELTKLTTEFSHHVLDATNAFELVITDEARLSGLPESARAAARESAQQKGLDGWRFTLQQPSVTAVLTYADDASLRETIYRASNARASSGPLDNRGLVARIVELRAEKARLLGFGHFADLVLEDRMAKTGAKASAFIDDLRARTQAAFERENQQLERFAGRALAPWDVTYFAEKQRQALYDFDEEELRPYFSVDRVLAGLFRIVETLYGVGIRERGAPAWDPAVRTYGLHDADGALIASFYVDLYPRENKRGGAWMNGIRSQAYGAGERQVGLFCANVSPPVGGKPALLTHEEVETLFHEFGHLMHHSLSRVSVRSLSGTSVAWDFVELPSQIMENWTWEREALDLFARHVDTGAPIPNDLLQKMTRARTYRAANFQMRQLGFATLDLRLHTDWKGGDTIAFAREVLSRHAPVELPADYAMVCSFTHLFSSPVGYAGGYYSYKWAEVLDADAFTRFAAEGVVNPAVGRAFRESILQKGDSEDPAKLFERFMGRAPSLDALLQRSGLLPLRD
jgi:oligopeptidase A